MMHLQKLAVASIAAIGAALVITPASAAPTGFQTHNLVNASESSAEVVLVGNRHKSGNKYWYKKHGNRNRHYRHRNRHRGYDNDNHFGGLGLGLGFGALALGGYGYGDGGYGYGDGGYGYGDGGYGYGDGGYGGGHVEYCLDRYRSYDLETNTFMGYDGYQHECISPYM